MAWFAVDRARFVRLASDGGIGIVLNWPVKPARSGNQRSWQIAASRKRRLGSCGAIRGDIRAANQWEVRGLSSTSGANAEGSGNGFQRRSRTRGKRTNDGARAPPNSFIAGPIVETEFMVMPSSYVTAAKREKGKHAARDKQAEKRERAKRSSAQTAAEEIAVDNKSEALLLRLAQSNESRDDRKREVSSEKQHGLDMNGAINEKLLDAISVVALEKIISEYSNHLNAVNIATALTQYSSLVQISDRPVPGVEKLQELMQGMRLDGFGARSLSTAMWALAKLKEKPHKVLLECSEKQMSYLIEERKSHIKQQHEQQQRQLPSAASDYRANNEIAVDAKPGDEDDAYWWAKTKQYVGNGVEPRHVVKLLWSYARFKYIPSSEFVSTCEQELEANLLLLSGQDICSVLWSFACWGRIPESTFYRGIMAAAVFKIPNFSGQQVCLSLWALSQLQQLGRRESGDDVYDWQEALVPAFEKRLSEHLETGAVSQQRALNALIALNKLASPMPEALLQAAYPRISLDRFTPKELCALLVLLCRTKLNRNKTFRGTRGEQDDFIAPQAVNVVPDAFMRTLEKRVLANYKSFQPKQMTTILWSWAMMNYQPESKVCDCFDEHLTKPLERRGEHREEQLNADLLRANELAHLLYSFARLGHSPSPSLKLVIERVMVERLPDFRPFSLAQTLRSLQFLGIEPTLYLQSQVRHVVKSYRPKDANRCLESFQNYSSFSRK